MGGKKAIKPKKRCCSSRPAVQALPGGDEAPAQGGPRRARRARPLPRLRRRHEEGDAPGSPLRVSPVARRVISRAQVVLRREWRSSAGEGSAPAGPLPFSRRLVWAPRRSISNHTCVEPSRTPQRFGERLDEVQAPAADLGAGAVARDGDEPDALVDDLDLSVLRVLGASTMRSTSPVAAVLHAVRDQLGDEQLDVGDPARRRSGRRAVSMARRAAAGALGSRVISMSMFAAMTKMFFVLFPHPRR